MAKLVIVDKFKGYVTQETDPPTSCCINWQTVWNRPANRQLPLDCLATSTPLTLGKRLDPASLASFITDSSEAIRLGKQECEESRKDLCRARIARNQSPTVAKRSGTIDTVVSNEVNVTIA